MVGFWRFLVPGLALWTALLYIWFASALNPGAIMQRTCSGKGRLTVIALVVASSACIVHLLAFVRGKGLASRANTSRLLLNGVLLYYATPMWSLALLIPDGDLEASKDPCFKPDDPQNMAEGAEMRTSMLAVLAIASAVLAWAGPRCTRRIVSKATRCCQRRRVKSDVSVMDCSGQTPLPDGAQALVASPCDSVA